MSATENILDLNRLACTFDPQSHAYFAGNRIMPGVSEVLRCVAFRDAYTQQHLDEYLRRGATVHALCAEYDRGVLTDLGSLEPTLAARVQAWATARKWCQWQTFAMIEMPLASRKHGFGGTPDRVFVNAEAHEVEIIDIKMSHHGWLAAKARLQLGGYAMLVQEALTVSWPIASIIVELRPNAMPKLTRYSPAETDAAQQAFRHVLATHCWLEAADRR